MQIKEIKLPGKHEKTNFKVLKSAKWPKMAPKISFRLLTHGYTD